MLQLHLSLNAVIHLFIYYYAKAANSGHNHTVYFTKTDMSAVINEIYRSMSQQKALFKQTIPSK